MQFVTSGRTTVVRIGFEIRTIALGGRFDPKNLYGVTPLRTTVHDSGRRGMDRPQGAGNQRAMKTFPLMLACLLAVVGSTGASEKRSTEFELPEGRQDRSQSWMVPVPCELPSEFRGRFKPFASVVCVDFTGDRQDDFIAIEKPSSNHNTEQQSDAGGVEWWIASSGRVIRRAQIYSSDHAYRWFQKLGRSAVPTIISAWGYSDGIDYTVQVLDLKTGKLRRLFFFDPVLVESDGQQYHGYPWDVSRLQTRVRHGEVLLRAEIRSRTTSDDESNDNEDNQQKCIPVLFFDGTSTQPTSARQTPRRGRWMSLDAIVKRTSAKTKSADCD